MADIREIVEESEMGIGLPMLGNPGRQRWLVIFHANRRGDGKPVQVWHAWREDSGDAAIERVKHHHRETYDSIEVKHACLIEGSGS